MALKNLDNEWQNIIKNQMRLGFNFYNENRKIVKEKFKVDSSSIMDEYFKQISKNHKKTKDMYYAYRKEDKTLGKDAQPGRNAHNSSPLQRMDQQIKDSIEYAQRRIDAHKNMKKMTAEDIIKTMPIRN